MLDWTEIIGKISHGINEQNLELIFVHPLLQELGFSVHTTCSARQSFTGMYKKESITIRPDFTCWRTPEKISSPILVVEDKKVHPKMMNEAIEQVQKQMIVTSAQFGLATNGLQIQLFQRHGQICVPRTRIREITTRSITKIIKEIKRPFRATSSGTYRDVME